MDLKDYELGRPFLECLKNAYMKDGLYLEFRNGLLLMVKKK